MPNKRCVYGEHAVQPACPTHPEDKPSPCEPMPNEETMTGKFEGHTPGPWRAGDIRHAGRTRLVDHDGPRGFVAEVYAPVRGNEWDEPTRDANARLMAAAPDLLRERDALKAAATVAAEWLEERFGNTDGHDWADESAAYVADTLEAAANEVAPSMIERERDEARQQRAENARLSAQTSDERLASFFGDPIPAMPLCQDTIAAIGGAAFFPQPTDHCEHGFAPGTCQNVKELCRQQVEAEAKRHEPLRVEIARLSNDLTEANARIDSLRIEAARYANGESIAVGKLALANSEIAALREKLGDERARPRQRCKQRILGILANLLEDGPEDDGGASKIWQVNVGDHERTENAVEELIAEFRRRAGNVGTGAYGEFEP